MKELLFILIFCILTAFTKAQDYIGLTENETKILLYSTKKITPNKQGNIDGDKDNTVLYWSESNTKYALFFVKDVSIFLTITPPNTNELLGWIRVLDSNYNQIKGKNGMPYWYVKNVEGAIVKQISLDPASNTGDKPHFTIVPYLANKQESY